MAKVHALVGFLMLLASHIEAESYKQKLNCLPGMDGCTDDYGKFDPPATDYLKNRLGPGVALGALCILICCLVWWCWCCCRCWARCCGCCRMGLCRCCCGAGTKEEDMIYTRCSRVTMAGMIFFAFCLFCVGGIAGYLGGHKTYDGGVDLMTQAVAAIEQMETLNTDVIAPAFNGLGLFFTANGGTAVTYDTATVTDAIKDVKKLINDFKDQMVSIKDIFNYALPGFYGFCAVISFLGCFSWWCGNGCCSMTMGMMSSVLLFLTWLLFIVFWVTGSFLDDTCVALSEHYHLDCMLEPGKTCQRAKLTDFFQCPKITTVSKYYNDIWNLVDSAPGNGAGTNQYGDKSYSINAMYGKTGPSPDLGTRAILAPASLTGAKCGTTNCTGATLGMEPYTTCGNGDSFNSADSTLSSYHTYPLVGNRQSRCTGDSSVTGNQEAPHNTAQTFNINAQSRTTKGIVAQAGSTNPPWASSTAPSFGVGAAYTIGTCERACLNASATSKEDGSACTTPGTTCILDSLSNFGGNAMYRKFVYESFTSIYTGASTTDEQGYATCGSDAGSQIAWTDNTHVANYATYQNFSAWMGKYSAMSYSDACIPETTGAISASRGCNYVDQTTYWQIPYDGTTANLNQFGCIQAAVMSVSDVMFALSYIASCEYIKGFAQLAAVESTGACFDLGDGLVFLIMAQGLVGCAFFITTVVGVMGYRRFQSDNYAENKKGAHDKEDDSYGVDQTDDPNDSYGVSTEMKGTGIQPNAPADEGGPPPPAGGSRDTWV